MEHQGRPKVDRKARLRIPPQKIPKQPPQERVRNWDEVALGLDPASARVESNRCLQCPAAPCAKACPLHNDIPGALWLLEQGDFVGAANVFRQTSTMPEVCGRVCPQERLCEGDCVVGNPKLGVRPVAIGALEDFAADYQRRSYGFPQPALPPPTGKRVAVVGAGPAGLTVAELLARRGHLIVVYDAWPRPGGILVYGIPTFKLPKAIVEEKVEFLQRLGVRFVNGMSIGADKTVDDLFQEGYEAVFLGHGAGMGMKLGVPGEDLKGIYYATDFLVRANLREGWLPPGSEPIIVGRRVAVVGGGDTAMDCTRTAIRMGPAEVTCVYRRTAAEMPGRKEEKELAKEEGIRFLMLAAPVRLMGDQEGRLKALECIRTELGEADESGRRRPIPVPGSEFTLEVDTVVAAAGYRADPLIPQTTPGLDAKGQGLIGASPDTGETSRPGVFAGGDCRRGPELVVTAVADGVRAAAAMDGHLRTS